MDSSQILSNLADMSRLELPVSVLQAIHKQLPESAKEHWAERWSIYLKGRPHQVCFRIRQHEVEGHLVAIGQEVSAVEATVAEKAVESDLLSLIRRVLREQYERETDGTVRLRAGQDVAADSLQSPHDQDASYRVKGGVPYRGGYVINVSETADPDNPVQLITEVQVEPNHTDDATLMEQSLDDQAGREITVE